MSTVAFLLPPRVHLLDLSGPAQVFDAATAAGAAYDLHYVAEQTSVESAQGLPVVASTTWPHLTSDDLVLVPGWRATGPGANLRPFSAATLAQLTAHHDRGGTVGSICAGAFALGAAGLLDGRRCTTHHDVQDRLQMDYPAAHVQPDVLFVTDGRVITSAGIASGIDLALDVVARRDGPALAARVARALVVFTRRAGDGPQRSAMLRHRDHLREMVHRAQDLIDARFAEPLPLDVIAKHAGVSPRTLTRAFREATGRTPLRYQQELRVERAELLVSQGATLESAAHEVGLSDGRMLRRLRARNPLLQA
ncbi:helix-turn-helix domain-containing protein [Calidifontibacter sp. DB0510]|uniref:Helix-turn-helix domain-containing protein n=1 Tax=Metallococcus carri TaxID=1656884 RepID=A0A967B506_9MICO|nr:DJ-1/PfpI family protein [Metallococcus carri]NHN57385.1 helix-turn-helix domain-containing protein [Metallococcus carri]NOP39219.1 helix-turn-helix domain-containing protein [Calidifontibacter sp. DB2511S]